MMSKFLGLTPIMGSGSAFGLGAGLPPSGPVPVISLATPNVSSAAGGWGITLTGSGFTGATAVKIAGVSASSIVIVNDTTITCNAPAFSTPNGTSTAQTISVKTSNGTGTSTNFYYYPSNSPIVCAYRGDVGLSFSSPGEVSAWADQSGNGFTMNTLPTTGSQVAPTVTTVNGLQVPQFQNAGMHIGSAPFSDGFITMICVASTSVYTSDGGNIGFIDSAVLSTQGEMGLSSINLGTTNAWALTDAVQTNLGLFIGPYNINQTYQVVGVNNGANSARYVNNDDTGATGTQLPLIGITDFHLGLRFGVGSYFFGPICEVMLYNAALSTADLTTIYNIQKVVWAIP